MKTLMKANKEEIDNLKEKIKELEERIMKIESNINID